MPDPRDQTQITHAWRTLFAQRVYQIACGYEDADDADDLRCDWAFKTALGRRPESDRDLASQPTFSRFENCVSRTDLRRMADVFVEQFVTRYATRHNCRIILDFDATDDETHGGSRRSTSLRLPGATMSFSTGKRSPGIVGGMRTRARGYTTYISHRS